MSTTGKENMWAQIHHTTVVIVLVWGDESHPTTTPQATVCVCVWVDSIPKKNLVDPASSHMLRSRAKPCKSQRTWNPNSWSVNGSLHQ